MLNHAFSFFPHQPEDEEAKHCQRLLKKDDNFCELRLEKFEQSFENSQDNPRNENQRRFVSGAAHAPLLLGSAQFRTLTRMHHPLIVEELSARNCAFCARDIDYGGKEVANGVNYLTKRLKELEYPDVDPNEDDKEQMDRHKIFKPRLMSSYDWTLDDDLTTTLEHCNNSTRTPDISSSTSF